MPAQCPAEVCQLLNKPLTTHAWNADKSRVAVCANSEEIYVLKRDSPQSKWTVEDVLKEHDQLITGLDWCLATDKIVSCSMDRNAYVWTRVGDKWQPTLAALRFSKSASGICWNRTGTKFAAGSSNGVLAVGYFEAENDWWICKHVKTPLECTITALAWHPNGTDLAVGTVDGHVLVTSGHIKSIDQEYPTHGGRQEFLVESFSMTSVPSVELSEHSSTPVLDVAFSSSGHWLAWLNYDGSLTVCDLQTNAKETISLGEWPMVQAKFVGDDVIVTTGHSYAPVLLGVDKSTRKWRRMDDLVPSDTKKSDGKAASGGFGNALARFKQMDDCGRTASQLNGQSLDVAAGHKNTVNKLSVLERSRGEPVRISTSSLDGNLIIWELDSVLSSHSLAGLSL